MKQEQAILWALKKIESSFEKRNGAQLTQILKNQEPQPRQEPLPDQFFAWLWPAVTNQKINFYWNSSGHYFAGENIKATGPYKSIRECALAAYRSTAMKLN